MVRRIEAVAWRRWTPSRLQELLCSAAADEGSPHAVDVGGAERRQPSDVQPEVERPEIVLRSLSQSRWARGRSLFPSRGLRDRRLR
jgi:hypothetical protein